MNGLLIKIACFSVVPIGGFLLVRGLRMVRNVFSGNVLAELPFTAKRQAIGADFSVVRKGTYAIWKKGRLFTVVPLSQFVPRISHQPTGSQLTLHRSLFRVSSNDGTTARTELFTFSAEAGRYQLTLVDGASISRLEHRLSKFLTALFKPAAPDEYVIQIRESQPVHYVLAGFLMLLLGGICIIGGLIAGFLSEQIFG